ncbi:hypothetical protein ACLB2K_063006 [Fragaria x ananassa]
MPKVRRSSSLSLGRSRASPYPCTSEDAEHYKLNSPFESTENAKEWEDTRCPICMEHPHNAVLIKCSSHEKGCRPFMCNTSYRHSNCLDQFCKSSVPDTTPMTLQELPLVHTAAHNSREEESLSGQTSPCGSQLQLHPACPFCRGKIYGYIVVRAARHFMNCKARSCSSETCDFTGTYSELRKHARSEHPYVRPAEVDPNRHRDWMRLERQRDWEDVLSIVQVGSEDDIIPDSSTDSGWMTSLLNAMFHSFEIMIVSHLMESSSDIEQTHSRRSGRTTRVHQDNNTVSPTRRNNTVSESRSHRSGLLYRATSNNVETSRAPRRSNNILSGEIGHAPPRLSNNFVSGEIGHAPPRRSNNLVSGEAGYAPSRRSNNSLSGETGHAPPRRSNNSLVEASAPRRGNSFSVVGTNRVLRRGNNTVLDNNSVPEESRRRRGSYSVSEESNRVHGWGNNSLSEEGWQPPRWGNTSVQESTPRPGRLRFRHETWPTNNNRRLLIISIDQEVEDVLNDKKPNRGQYFTALDSVLSFLVKLCFTEDEITIHFIL